MPTATTQPKTYPEWAAYWASEYGYHVFPAWIPKSGDKVPLTQWRLGGDGERPLKERCATTDLDTIRAWFTELRPLPEMICFATGEPSGVWVLDLDKHGASDGVKALAELGELPRTRVHHTPTGGQHWFFRMPADGRTIANDQGLESAFNRGAIEQKIPGVDVRGTGGMCVLPPSARKVKGRTMYYQIDGRTPEPQDAPGWLLDIVASDEWEVAESRGRRDADPAVKHAAEEMDADPQRRDPRGHDRP